MMTSLTGTIRQHWRWMLVALYLATGIYSVRTDEQGVVRTLGRAAAEPARPGLHYRLPPPFSRLDKVKVYERKRVSIGFAIADEALGQQPSAAETQFLTGDQNLVNIQMLLQYSISDPRRYLFASEAPAPLLQAAAAAALTRVLATSVVDNILTIGKVETENRVQELTQQLVNQYGIGVQVDAVTLTGVYPPDEVADAFKDVASARGDAERIVNEAHGYAGDLIPRARGEADSLREAAAAYRDKVVNEANGDADRFNKLYAAYLQAKDVTSARIYLEAMEEVLPKMKKMVVDDGNQPLDITLLRESNLAGGGSDTTKSGTAPAPSASESPAAPSTP